jgi:hypothetical protein
MRIYSIEAKLIFAMLVEVIEELERWVLDQNAIHRAEGLPLLRACEIRVLGQTALLEQRVPLTLAATRDAARYDLDLEQFL